jgi:hypothetical protein
MRCLALLLAPAALIAGQARYARLGEMEGRPEIQLHGADAWAPASRNTPLIDGAWVRTGPGSRAEIELDEGGVFRLDAASLAELSDYTRLSTGQRVTLVSLDRGVAYFTGEAEGRDALALAVPGAQATIRRGARVRLEARETWSQIAVIEGAVTFSSPAAELEIKEGQMVRVEPANSARFFLYREVTALDSDAWSEQRDKAQAASHTAAHLAGLRYGLAELDAGGAWIETAPLGTVWKPKAAAGWAPFRDGRWAWYDGLGYTWIANEPWGWLPYHYGRWTLDSQSGWIWVPGKDAMFSPGDVYWLQGARLAGWGPLAPGEDWKPEARPQLYVAAHTTFAAFPPEARELNPVGFTPPREPKVAFVAALPSPAMPAARLEAQRPALRAGSTRVVPHLSGVTFEDRAEAAAVPPPPPPEQPVVNTTVIQPAPPAPVVVVTPPPEPTREVYYPVPVYSGIVVVNPPERQRERRKEPVPVRRQDPPRQKEAREEKKAAPPAPAPAAKAPEPAPKESEAAPKEPEAAQKPVSRTSEESPRNVRPRSPR